ncbi:MAG: hypothetical protein JXR48_07165 [Candidatus Delongbacteria bacterium]|nr:hypothetical protein [Candidatus Delongbacteria bacterium]MBN2834731.1 hypothetical protein [Candidatus Delongbacteria bacterium]
MKKLVTVALMLIVATAALAEFDGGFKVRFRHEMGTVGTSYDADSQTFKRAVDFRFRPWFGYKVNDMLSVKWQGEIGDSYFGNPSDGTGVATDGKTFETKHLYMDVKPSKEMSIRLGLQGYADPHSIVFDDDIAGVNFGYKMDQMKLVLGWFVPYDGGESNKNEETWSFGQSMFAADFGYEVQKGMNVGLNAIFVISSIDEYFMDIQDEDGNMVSTNIVPEGNTWKTTSMYFSPNFQGDFGMFNVNTQFTYFMASHEFESLTDEDAEDFYDDDTDSGMAFSLKAGVKATDELGIRLNFLYLSSDDKGEEYYMPTQFPDKNMEYKSRWFPSSGLEILTSSGAPDGMAVVSPYGQGPAGLMFPAIFADYMINKELTVSLGLGFGMTMEDVSYLKDGEEETDTMLGTEVDLKANWKLFDKLKAVPYAAFLLPGNALSKTDKTDMQMKVGMTLHLGM